MTSMALFEKGKNPPPLIFDVEVYFVRIRSSLPPLPKRGAPALGKRKSYNSARACVYLPIQVGTFTLDGLGNTRRMIKLWVTGPKRMINTQIHLVRQHG